MRTLKLLSVTIVVIGLLVAMYIRFQPAQPVRTASAPVEELIKRAESMHTTAPPASNPSGGALQAGEDVWVKVPDAKTGRLAWQFRATSYDPQPDNSVKVTQPQAEFFFIGGQRVTIVGTHGRVIVPGEMGKDPQSRMPAAAPSRGELFDVTISLFHPDRPRRAVMVCKMNNVAFDNDTFRIFTDSFTSPTGQTFSPDQVPVQVRGDDYDFDGKGLLISWAERDRRLESLTIAHGETLTVKNMGEQFGASPGGKTQSRTGATPTRPAGATPRPSGTPRPRPVSRPATAVAADDATADSLDDDDTATTRPARQPVYRATFDGGVRITQATTQLAMADTLRVDFKLADDDGDSKKPAARSSSADSGASPSTPRPGARTTAPAAARKPATQKDAGSEPIVIRWPGKLVVVPLDPSVETLQPGDMNVQLDSAARPVVLDYTGWHVVCGNCAYQSEGRDAQLGINSAVPIVTINDANGALITTPSLKYEGAAGRATLEGASRAQMPIAAEGNQPASKLLAAWSKLCVLTMDPQSSSIQQADLSGDVDVTHPKLKLKSDALALTFSPPATQPTTRASTQTSPQTSPQLALQLPAPTTGPARQQTPPLKQLRASGNVLCDVLDPQQPQHISADALTVDTTADAAGQIHPTLLTADGRVVTRGDKQELRAGHLVATLAPSTQPTDSPHLQTFLAQQDVTFKTEDASGHADQLDAVAEGDDYALTLKGQPLATITSRDSTIAGAIIVINPKRQNLQVVGAGSLTGQQASTTGGKPQPFEVTWDHGLEFSGSTNTGLVDSNVVIVAHSADGTVNHITGDKLSLTLMDDPRATTAPTTSEATTKPTTRSANPLSAGGDPTSKKSVKSMTLDGNVEALSVLSDPSGALLRRVDLFSSQLVFDSATQHVIVPVPGRMLYEDRRATTQPTSAPSSPLGDFSGATAFQWSNQLDLDQAGGRAALSGDVHIVHGQPGAAGDTFRLDADTVTADLDRPPTTQKSGAVDDAFSSAMNVKLITAEGAVQFTSRQIQFSGERMRFDPIKQLLKAEGTDRTPLQLYDAKGVSTGMFREIWWDTRTQQILKLRDVQATIRR